MIMIDDERDYKNYYYDYNYIHVTYYIRLEFIRMVELMIALIKKIEILKKLIEKTYN